VRFHEHEYDQDPGKEAWKKAADDAVDMVHEFSRLPYLDQLVSADPKDVLEVEQLRKWSFVNCPVWIKIDLAYRDAQGTVHVVDWKTGKWIRDDNPIQLLGYASYVSDKWETPLEKMAVREVYLRRGGEEKCCELSEDRFTEAHDRILESIRSMLGALDDPNLNVALEDDFPTAPDERKCERCFFRRICPEVETG
jgi:CRISPR/Cas system-associated exonuclease Cas4 (RecB family)